MSKNVNFIYLTSLFSKTWRNRAISQPASYLVCKDTSEIFTTLDAFYSNNRKKVLKHWPVLVLLITYQYIIIYIIYYYCYYY